MSRLLHATEPQPTAAPAVDEVQMECHWIVRVDGAPAAHHVLRVFGVGATAVIARCPLPPWASARQLVPRLSWACELRPLVLRPGAGSAAALGVDGSAPAVVLCERGRDESGVRVEHQAVIHAKYAAHAPRPPGRR